MPRPPTCRRGSRTCTCRRRSSTGRSTWPSCAAATRPILVDSGLGTEFPDFPRAGQLAMRLDAAGIDPASVTDVVLTHLHMDHIGGLLVDGLQEPAAAGSAGPPGGGRGRVLGGARLLPHRHAGADSGRASADCHAVPRRVPRPAATVRDGVRGGARRAAPPHRRSHPRPQHRPRRVRRRGTDIRRRRRVPARIRQPRLAERFRTRPGGVGPRPDPAA